MEHHCVAKSIIVLSPLSSSTFWALNSLETHFNKLREFLSKRIEKKQSKDFLILVIIDKFPKGEGEETAL